MVFASLQTLMPCTGCVEVGGEGQQTKAGRRPPWTILLTGTATDSEQLGKTCECVAFLVCCVIQSKTLLHQYCPPPHTTTSTKTPPIRKPRWVMFLTLGHQSLNMWQFGDFPVTLQDLGRSSLACGKSSSLHTSCFATWNIKEGCLWSEEDPGSFTRNQQKSRSAQV